MADKVVVPANLGRQEATAKALEDAGYEIVRLPNPQPGDTSGFTPELIQQYFADAAGFMGVFPGRRVTREVMQAAPKLRVGVSPIIGTENFDVDAATELGIVIGYGAAPENLLGVAEAVVMLAAALVKHLPQKWEAVRSGGWRVNHPGNMMQGRTIGLVGFGNIGQAVAKRLAGWDTKIIAADPFVKPEVAQALDVRLVDLDTLMRESDVVSVMVTLSEGTKHLIGEHELSLMKPSAYLINTSRGPCVDEQALIRALQADKIAGVAIDVWEQEPTAAGNPLRGDPRVITTAHNIGHSEEVYAALPGLAAENLLRGLRGQEPVYTRNPEVLPRWHKRMAEMGVIPVPMPQA